MELWVRSQDKLMLLKVDAFTISEDPNNKRGFGILDGYTVIGWYKSKERALEVLDEMQKLLMPTIEYNPVVKKEESWEEEYQRTVLKGYDVKIEQAITYVYEMPKE